MIYATSDLHGYSLAGFQALLRQARFGDSDFLYVLGDVIDRGAEGVTTLQWMMKQPNVELIRGNHEAMMLACSFVFDEVTEEMADGLTPDKLAALANWMMNGAKPTLDALRALHLRWPGGLDDLLDYVFDTPLYEAVSLERGDFILTHAGLGHFDRNRPLRAYRPDDLLWHRPAADERYFDDVTVVFGHTPTEYYGSPGRPFRTDTWIDIDTGAAMGGAPMLLRLDDMKSFFIT